jgi:hypothetical protein
MTDYLNPKISKKLNQFIALRNLNSGSDNHQVRDILSTATNLIQLLVADNKKLKKQLLMQNAELEKLKK